MSDDRYDDLAAKVAALADEWDLSEDRGWLASAAERLRALLGGDTSALDRVRAEAWDEGREKGITAGPAFGYTLRNPYRARAGGSPT